MSRLFFKVDSFSNQFFFLTEMRSRIILGKRDSFSPIFNLISENKTKMQLKNYIFFLQKDTYFADSISLFSH